MQETGTEGAITSSRGRWKKLDGQGRREGRGGEGRAETETAWRQTGRRQVGGGGAPVMGLPPRELVGMPAYGMAGQWVRLVW